MQWVGRLLHHHGSGDGPPCLAKLMMSGGMDHTVIVALFSVQVSTPSFCSLYLHMKNTGAVTTPSGR
jgi:hypothetical protein